MAEVREHVDACARRSEPFSQQRLTFYQTVQWDLHRRIGPPAVESETFPGFERMGALVMHAEDHCASATAGSGGSATPELPDPLQLFVPVSDAPTGDLFPTGRRVLLYLYPAGSLLGKSPPTAPPVAYEGSVTMNNVVRDASAEGRPATCCIADLGAPRIKRLPAAVVPKPAGEILQVVIRLNEQARGPLPIFHAARQAPRLKLGIEYVTVDRDEPHQPRAAEHTVAPPIQRAGGGSAAMPEYRAPRYLTLEATVNVPSPHLYTYPIEPLLNRVLLTSHLSDPNTLPDITIAPPPSGRALNAYVYHVEHWLSKETMAQVQTQMKLF